MAVDFWVTLGFGVVLVASAAGMMASHVRTWRSVREQPDAEPGEIEYRRRQFRRRMQTSAMLGVLGVAMLVGHWVRSPHVSHWTVFLYWGAVLLMVIWLALLAVADIVSTRLYFGRLRRDYELEQFKLRSQLRRLQRTRGNGKPGR